MSTGWDSDDHLYQPPLFQETFNCLPFDEYKNPELESGNKIVMPASSLSLLAVLGVQDPWLFKVESFASDKASHCGVLEFCADEGFVYMPRWMMANLGVRGGDRVILSVARPPRATWMRLQPHATAFVEVSNVRAVLETALRGFSCLSKGDTFAIGYNGVEFLIDVVDVGPGGEAVSLIETDCEVEFAPPLDYVEPPKAAEEEVEEEEGEEGFRPFTGRGRRLDGREAVAVAAVEDFATAAAEVEGGGKEERVREFRPFEGVARRLDGGGGGSAAVVGEPARSAAAAGAAKRREKEEEKFKPFTGRGRVLGGPNFFD